MPDLDSREDIAKIDKENVLGSVEELDKQCEHAFEAANKVNVPKTYKNIDAVVMGGMGGSGLGARVIESVFANKLNKPFLRVNDYDLPGFVNSKTLVICSSYSGTTEETVANAKQAVARKAKWMAIGTGNALIDLARKHKAPYYQIEAKYNPSNQPRMAIGYSVVGQLVLASKAGLFSLSQADVNSLTRAMQTVKAKARPEVKTAQNQAKQLAQKMLSRNVFYIASEHLIGAMHTVNNQLNENAKTFSGDYAIPELNHHLMEGLKHPQANSKNLFMFFAASNLYSKRISQRHTITQDVVSKNKIKNFVYKAQAKTKLAQAFELIQFGAYANLYLSVLYEQNPAPIPWVDYFKKQLGQPLGR